MILVTGATGNVGRNVVRQLLDAGEKVRAITRDPARAETLPAALRGVDRAFLFPVFGSLGDFLRIGAESGLRHVVLLSSYAVVFPEPGWIGEQHIACERAVQDSGLAWTFVRPGA